MGNASGIIAHRARVRRGQLEDQLLLGRYRHPTTGLFVPSHPHPAPPPPTQTLITRTSLRDRTKVLESAPTFSHGSESTNLHVAHFLLKQSLTPPSCRTGKRMSYLTRMIFAALESASHSIERYNVLHVLESDDECTNKVLTSAF